jgi:hypothetical protein
MAVVEVRMLPHLRLAALSLAVALTVPPATFAHAPMRARAPFRPHVIDLERKSDTNQLNSVVTNIGSFGFDLQVGNPGVIYPRGTTNGVLFAGGLWVIGKVAGTEELRAAIAEYSMEYGPGPILGGTFDPNRYDDKVWKVARWRGDPQDTMRVDRTEEEMIADPTLDRIAHHSWSEYLTYAAPYGAPTRVYRLPVAPGDSIDVVGPDVQGDVMLWSVFNDLDPANHTNAAGSTAPMGVEVQCTVFAYDDPGPLGRTVFFRHRIINKSSALFDTTFVGVWSDPDLGGFADDLVGCDPVRALGYCYNATNNDAVYGADPPAVGFVMLASPSGPTGGAAAMRAFNKYIGGTDPNSPFDVYHYMQGLNPDGTPIIDPTTGLPTTYFHSGDPVAGTGWLDSNPADRRMLLASGAFAMAPGDTEEVFSAMIVGQGPDRLASIADLRCAADYVSGFVANAFPDPPPPPDPNCAQAEVAYNCPRPASYWAAECPGGGLVSIPDFQSIATSVATRSAFWEPLDATPEFCGVMSGGGDLRTQALREYLAFMASISAGVLGVHETDGDPIRLREDTPISCPGLEAATISQLAETGTLDPTLVIAQYLNHVTLNRRALEGVEAGLASFGGGADVAWNFFGSTLDPAASPDSFATVEVRFDHTATQKAYRYLRLELDGGGFPTNGREYRYGGYRDVPFTVWDVERNVQLAAMFVERTVIDDFGTILDPAFQVATFDSTWGPDDSDIGSREYLVVLRSAYDPVPDPFYERDGAFSDSSTPGLYGLWSRLRSPVDVIDDGDAFVFEWGFESPGADQMLIELAGQPLSDPAVQQGYQDLIACLSAINAGIGIGTLCDDETPVQVSLVSAEATAERVLVVWHVADATGLAATIERREPETGWAARGEAIVDGGGFVTFEDADPAPGARLGYRLIVRGAGALGETWVEVPGSPVLALGGVRADGNGARVRFTLASRERATLDVLDLAGRRVASADVSALGPGSHEVVARPAGALPAGVYIVRLVQGGRAVTAKAALVR